MLFLQSCYGGKQLLIDKKLSGESEKWQAQTKKGTKKIQKAEFGPYAVIHMEMLDSSNLKKSSLKFFSFPYPGRLDSTKKRRLFTLTIANGPDTANLFLTIWNYSYSKEPGLLKQILDKNADTETWENKNALGAIQINQDSSLYSFSVGPYAGWVEQLQYDTHGSLDRKDEHYNIEALNEFINGGGGTGTKGITIKNKAGEHLATLQLVGKNYVWIKKDLPADLQLSIASLFISVLGTKEK